ncbi:MAG: hypothetical protein L0216_12310 [Planctomycetales bacterium]|nr:hypothetical protein [Planctomycetales bacterium]
MSERRVARSGHRLLRWSREGALSLLAGGRKGTADGTGEAAEFEDLSMGALAVAPDGSVLLADGNRIRRVAKDGTVTTVAGGTEEGDRDGRGAEARFRRPSGLALSPGGALVVADFGNHKVRRVAPDGTVTTLAGTGERGFRDGPASEALLDHPVGVAVAREMGSDPIIVVYVKESLRQTGEECRRRGGVPRVRRIAGGRCTTLNP